MGVRVTNLLRWFAVAVFALGAAVVVHSARGQPSLEGGRELEPVSRGRVVRVGLPGPIGARGMLRGTPQDPQGFLRKLMEMVAEAEGLAIEFVALDKEAGKNHAEELAKGRIDVLAGATVGETNLRQFRLSAPVVVTPGVAVIREGASSPKTVDELRKLRVVVPAGGAGRAFALEQGLSVVPKSLYREGFESVSAGNADAMLTTMLAARYEIERSGHRGLQLSELEPTGFRRAYAYAVRPDDTALLAAIDGGLAAVHHDGRFRELYQREVARYQPMKGPRAVTVSTALHYAAGAAAVLVLAAVVWQWRVRRRLASLARVLAESEERYKGIFDLSHDAVMTVDPATERILEANAAAERMYGYGKGEMAGVGIGDLVEDPAALRERTRRVLESRSLRVSRSRHKRRDGRPIIADVHASTGTIGGRTVIVAMSRDVTATASYEELVRSVIESSPHVAIQGFDKRGRVHFWNAASARLYGWTAEEAVGREMGDLIADPVAQAGLVALLRRLEAEGRPSGLMEFQVHSKTGEPRWVLSEIVPAPDVRGELQFVCVEIDVTAMKLAERRLQDAQARLASALEAAGTGTWSIDVESQTIDPDPSLARLVGLDPSRKGPIPLAEIAAKADLEDRPRVLEAIGAAMRGERPYRAEYRVVLPDGERRWLSSRGTLIRDAQGAVVSISGACVDVTEAKQAAVDAEHLRDELERARRLESLGLLAGGLAHDFNNMLVGIRGNSELAMRSLGDGAARRALELVVQATDRTAELTGQLLAAAGRSRLAPEPLDLNAAASESVAVLRARLGQGVGVEFELASPAPRTRADGAQTRQAVSNLLTNASDAVAGRAGGRVVVRTGVQRLERGDFDDPAFKVRAAPGEFVYVEVADNGCGMDDRVLARVFDPFYSTKAAGRGLGLSLVMMTVRRHEGAIRIESRPGEGTVCRLLLPLVATPEGTEANGAGAAGLRAGSALVVDDEPMVRGVMGAMLRQEGWRVSEAASGEAGLRLAEAEAFDMVFLDLTMPGMSGVETASRLRVIRPHMPIVFVSGYSREMADASGTLAGEVFVQKPFDVAGLLAAAEAAASGRKAAGLRTEPENGALAQA